MVQWHDGILCCNTCKEIFCDSCRLLFFTPPEATDAAEYTEEQVAEFLKSIGLAQYVEIFQERQVDGGMMLEIDDEILEALGVKSHLHKIKIVVLFKRLLTGKATRLEFSYLYCHAYSSLSNYVVSLT